MANSFKDDRGRSYNNIFSVIQTGDINLSILYPNTIKAFHKHEYQDDHWFCVKGNLRVVLVTEEEVEVPVGEPIEVVWFKPGVTVVNPDSSGAPNQYTGYQYREYIAPAKTANPDFKARYNQYYTKQLKPIVTVKYLKEGEDLFIPKGVWHGVQNIGVGEAIMLYYINNKYNENKPDEIRAPWNKFYTWEATRK